MVDITEASIVPEVCLEAVGDPAAGGTALFVGTVRDHDEGRDVAGLEYLAHPQALRVLGEVLAEVADDCPGCTLAAMHRVGKLEIGDVAVVVAAASPHRSEAFAAARMLIDEIKSRVPIWKRQFYVDGGSSWVGCDDVGEPARQ
ncbi:MAG: molybdenum cofactor biosynthesis protein MoaE [Acidimicrobiales bacterium]